MTDTDQKLEDDVLRRMLATKPRPHKSTGLTPSKSKKSNSTRDPLGVKRIVKRTTIPK